MMPPYSWLVPGMKPGTSTNVTTGMLKASQKRTKRAALIELLISRQPANTRGWLATIPTVWPSMRAKPMRMFLAYSGCSSKKSPSSTVLTMSSFMSYGLFGLSGTRGARGRAARGGGGVLGRPGAAGGGVGAGGGVVAGGQGGFFGVVRRQVVVRGAQQGRRLDVVVER